MDLGHIVEMDPQDLLIDIYVGHGITLWLGKKVVPFTEIGKTGSGRHSGLFNGHISLRCSLEIQDVS